MHGNIITLLLPFLFNSFNLNTDFFFYNILFCWTILLSGQYYVMTTLKNKLLTIELGIINTYECESWTVKTAEQLSTEKLMFLNCGVGEDSWESLGLQGDPTSAS